MLPDESAAVPLIEPVSCWEKPDTAESASSVRIENALNRRL
jgi:hypothetical protein